jgi:uncharacterized protein YjbI with pentapeptide repeats
MQSHQRGDRAMIILTSRSSTLCLERLSVADVKARAGETKMARPWIRRIGWIAVAAIAVIVEAFALLWMAIWLWFRVLPAWNTPAAVTDITILAIAILALMPLAAIWWLWWQLPRRQVRRLDIQIHDPKARADTEDNFRKTVGQALGGAAVLIGAVVAYLQFTQQQQASHDLLISNQVSKGFEQLASDKITERLGGIYALEGVINTSIEYHQPVLEALCAFVRENTTRQKGPLTVMLEALSAAQRGGTAGDANITLPNDIQAALTVIGRRKRSSEDVDLFSGRLLFRLDLNGAHIPGANLNGAHLNGANLSRANLIGANLGGAYLTGADLNGATLNGANLDGAYLNGAVLGDADLTGATLTGALLGADLTGANLSRADVRDTNLSGADLRLANLSGADLRLANLSGADLNSADLSDADMTNVWNLTQEHLDKACGKPKALPPGLTLDKPCPPPKAQ